MRTIFDDLFVLEMANNHWGDLDRGLRIIGAYAKVVRFNNVRAALKLQFRDVPTFIHKDFLHSDDRYIRKTLATAMPRPGFQRMVADIKRQNCLAMATPFDETSVEWCRDLDLVKIASSDINDWFLIEAIAKLRKPVIVSTGGSSLKDIDDLVLFFEHRNIPLAINHCVALYPTRDEELELDQVDFLRGRYPNHVIGLSTHECGDWRSSMLIAYAKGCRTFERHVDIEGEQPVSPYCSLPHQVDEWFQAWHLARRMCGGSGGSHRVPSRRETEYLDKLVRGVYARQDLPQGHVLTSDDVYLAIPWQEGQLSCRTFMYGEVLAADVAKDRPLLMADIETPFRAERKVTV